MFWVVGWLASSFAAHTILEALGMIGYWPLAGFKLSDIMGHTRLSALCATFFVAVLLGEFFRTAIVALAILCFSAAMLSHIDRSTGLIGRYALFFISCFAIGFALVRAVMLARARFQ